MSAGQASELRVTALLGRRDQPTDALEDYSRYLAAALREYQIEMDLVRVPWPEQGWTMALQQVERRAPDWRGRWVLVQYIALPWSRRALPPRFLRLVNILPRAARPVSILFTC